MDEIKFINLHQLLENHFIQIERIKEQYILLLSELTLTNSIETTVFIDNVKKISKIGTIIVGYTGEPSNDNFKLIASGTIIIEPKIIRNCKNVGHIEDIVVSKSMQGKNLSQKILDILKEFAKNNDCYKIILDCNDTIKQVYIKNGFKINGIQMAKYFQNV